MKKLLITTFIFLLPTVTQAAITRVSERSVGVSSPGLVSLTTPTFNAVSGNLIVLCVRETAGNVLNSITDTAGNTYTLAASDVVRDPSTFIYYAKNITGNASNAVTVNFQNDGSNIYEWVDAIQYSGIDPVSPLDAASSKQLGTGKDFFSSPITTSQNNEVLVSCVSQNNLATYTEGIDFGLVNGLIGDGTGATFGGSEEYITHGTLSAYTAHFTTDTTISQGSMLWASFKAPGWYDTNYAYCRTMTMTAGGNSGGVATTTTQGFPLVATSTISSLAATSSGGRIQKYDYASSTPTDVIITSGSSCTSAGAPLKFYFESYSSTTGAFTLWVKPMDISSTTGKTVLMYYGNTSGTYQGNKSGVWNSQNERLVYNMNENPAGSAPQMKDATPYANSGTTGGSMPSGSQIAGQVNGALSFDGVDDYVTAGHSTSLAPSVITFGFWINPTAFPSGTGTFGEPLRKEDSYHASFIGDPADTNHDTLELGVKVSGVTSSVFIPEASIPIGKWTHIVLTADGSNVRGYVNGVQSGAPTAYSGAISNTAANDVFLATYGTNSTPNLNRWFNGKLDDVRIYGTAVHPMDIKTIFNNESNSAVFWTFGSEQAYLFSNSAVHGFLKVVNKRIKIVHKLLKIW